MAARRERVIIWGAGGHGRVVSEIVLLAGHDVVAFVDKNPVRDSKLCTREVISEAEFVAALAERQLPFDATAVALGIGDNTARQRAMARLGGANVPVFLHPSSAVSVSAQLGRGTVVMANAVINADASLGACVIVNSGAVVEHDCVVADAAHLSPHATLAGGVRVGVRTWIGAGSVVLENVTVGEDVIVGAGAVVLRDVSDDETVVGVPARMVRGGAE